VRDGCPTRLLRRIHLDSTRCTRSCELLVDVVDDEVQPRVIQGVGTGGSDPSLARGMVSRFTRIEFRARLIAAEAVNLAP
jgi:hypothetical protein